MISNLLVPLEHRGQKIMTTEQLAEAYGAGTNNIKKNFSRNKERFIEGTHYYLLEGDKLRAFKREVTNCHLVALNINQLYLWTERGAFLHAKSLNTDQAWNAYEQLIDFYFKTRDAISFSSATDPQLINQLFTKIETLESRLSLLETKEEACKEERQSDIFLKALQDALDSGEYYIRPKRAHAPELCASRLLGVYDRHEIAIRSLPAYALYQAATSRPMRIRTLWEVLEREGTIAPRTEAGRICKISGKECAAVFISRNSLTVGGRG